MIEQVRGLAREARPVLAGGGEHRLDRLLADLLGDLGHPFLEQPRRVRARRFVAGARGDRTGETREGAAGRLAEAGGRAGVAGWPLLAHDVQHRIAIAVHTDVFHGLRVARGRALLPQLAARAAAVVGLAGRARPFQGLAVGVRHHQHLAGERALRHDGDESVGPEAHGLNPIVGGGGHSLNLSALPCIVKIPAAGISLRPMGWVASVFALGLIMALLHRLTAGSPVEARATLALGFLLLAALAGGELAKRVRLPRVTGALLIGFAAGPAWLGLIRRDEANALQLVADAAVALIALAAGTQLTLETWRTGRTAFARLATGAIAFPFAVVTLVAWSVSRGLPIAAHQPWLDRLTVALVLGTLAAAASPAITLAMIDEMRARGPLARSLLAVTVAQDVAVPILFTAVLLGSKALASAAGLRVVSLRYGLRWAARHPAVTPVLARTAWLGLISQGGTAVALAQLARRAFPEWGVSLETLLVAIIGVHEVAGPICFRQALLRAGEVLERDAEGTHGGAAALGDGTVVASGGV